MDVMGICNTRSALAIIALKIALLDISKSNFAEGFKNILMIAVENGRKLIKI